MDILYISKMTGKMWAGPNSSVPAQIKAQAKYDNVFWYNMNEVKIDEWDKMGVICHNIDDYPTGRLRDLPSPFNNPSLVVVEEFYTFPFEKIIIDIQHNKIPYIIVPRSTMTKKAQKHKAIKKWIGNKLYFYRMAKKAAGIQFLTKEEKTDSGLLWNRLTFVIPNGIEIPLIEKKTKDTRCSIQATYIGRIEPYQKGLDILLEAVGSLQDICRQRNFRLSLWGPDIENGYATLNSLIAKYGIEDIIQVFPPVYGEEKKKLLCETDVFIMTSRFEGLPMSMLEALSYGIPCIASEGTNLRSEIEKFDAGWGTDNTIEGIQNALKKMICEYNEYEKKGENAIELANKYSWDTIAEETHEIYKRIVEGSW